MTPLTHWHEGMFMRVQNMQMLQQGLLERIEEVHRLSGPFGWGVLEATVARDRLEKGEIQFSRLHAVMEKGLHVRLPDDGTLKPLPVRQELEDNASKDDGTLAIYLAVPDYAPNQPNVAKPGDKFELRTHLRYSQGTENRADENTGENHADLAVRSLNARLLFGREVEVARRSGVDCLLVAKIRRVASSAAVGGRIELVRSFSPPCLCLSFQDFDQESLAPTKTALAPDTSLRADQSVTEELARLIASTINRFEASRSGLRDWMSKAKPYGAGTLTGATMLKILRFQSVSRHAGRLLGLKSAPGNSPFDLFLVFSEVLGELEALQPRWKSGLSNFPKYDHLRLFSVFEEIDRRVEMALREIEAPENLSEVFKPEPGRPEILRAVLRPDFFGPKVARYLLAIRSSLPTEEVLSRVKAVNFELTVPSDVGRASGGMPLTHTDEIPGDLPTERTYYFEVEHTSPKQRARDLWRKIQETMQLGLGNQGFTDSEFTFYAILQPRNG